MKKTLSVVLTSAMALSMFSSVAFGKTSADFTDLKDLDAATKVKFDAMITAGIFDGVTETTFGLKDEMNRAQFAKVAALIMGLEVNKDLKTSTFTDVSVTDAANGYALPYIEALKTAGVTDGYAEGQYNPAGKVTKEQLATFLVRVLGQDAAAKGKTGTDTTVSGWAQGYVALALELKLLSNGTDGKFGGMTNATRDLLVTGAYEAKQQYVPAGKVSVTGAKATGVQQVTVSFNKPVDTAKATLALTKGTLAVASTVKFTEDKKSAVLTLTDYKITEGNYSVSLSGLDAAAVDKATANFTAENEKVTKIDFVNASEKIALSNHVKMKLKAVNQYGENASFIGGSYTAYVNGSTANLTRNDDTGLLELNVDTTTVGGNPSQPEVSVLPVNVFFTNSSVSVQKTFKIGTAPYVTKVELGDVSYPNNAKALMNKGEVAEIAVTRIDQYGDAIASDYTGAADMKAEVIVTPYSNDAFTIDKAVTDWGKVKVTLSKNVEKDTDFTLTTYVGSASATKTVSVKSSKVANKVEIAPYTGTIAEADTNKYITLVAYDAAGNKLSAEDIVTNAKEGRFTIQTSGATLATGTGIATVTVGGANTGIVESGEHKGQLKLATIDATERGIVFLNVGIYSSETQNNDTEQFTVQEGRKPVTITVVTDPASKAILGADSKFKLVVKDQFGETLDGRAGLLNKYALKTSVTGAAYGTIDGQDADYVYANNQEYSGNAFTGFNKGFVFNTDGDAGKMEFTAQLVEIVNPADRTKDKEIKKVTKSIETVASSTELTYALTAVSDLYAALDSSQLTTGQKDAPLTLLTGRTLEITAKDNAGNNVVIPQDRIVGVTSSDSNVLKVTFDPAGKAKLNGYKAGTANVTVTFTAANGEVKDMTTSVKVKGDAVAVASLTAGNTTKTVDNDAVPAVYDIMDLALTDNYGIEYKGTNIDGYKLLTGGLVYTVSGVTGGTVSVDQTTGAVTIGAGVTEFTLKAISNNGKTATTLVTVID
ncbi:S-layer homology domain-containing protein [Paenibacillus sp. V4I7]|uniref:S-layer homology domain-containing protein n=1 Tax=Paenibacillus sp. V4I7 TaxID=3042307 RepID=UPI0027887F8B|nr:S-layer homology domain-containing protein [Paenibacillus sp. V4I7]MDQ0902962.1 hypothetical protein [Paenibacillus sp. V4I7]MDQ0902963.1 hypothetical protein [Paenibacillus sp. V4I7]